MITFFKINENDIKTGKRYSFPIYSYCKNEQVRETLFYPSEEITKEKMISLKQNLNAVKEFHIYFKDIRSYLQESDTNYEDFSEINKERFEYIGLCDQRVRETANKNLIKMIANTASNKEENSALFKELRLNVVRAVLKYRVSESEILNTTICLVEKLFTRDYKSVKVAALAFNLAKKMGIIVDQQLANILLLSLFKNIGKVTQREELLTTDLSQIIASESKTLLESLQFLGKYEESIFSHLAAEITKMQNQEEKLYKKYYEIILASQMLCLALEQDDFSLEEKDQLFTSLNYEFEYVEQIKYGLESLL